MVSSENSAALSYAVPEGLGESVAHVDAAKYKDMYDFSASEPDSFWEYHGKRIDWIKPFTKVKRTCFDPGNVSIKWFEDGTTNVASNCIDRHLAKRAEQIAIIWEGGSRARKMGEDDWLGQLRRGAPAYRRRDSAGKELKY